jgi:hypothetical protein
LEAYSLEILKLIFAREADGWAIQNMKGIALKSEDEQSTFYKIRDDLIAVEPNIIGSTSWFMGRSIVPIVANVEGDNTLRCIGTGFFISCTGLLLTAAHVISDPIERNYGDVYEAEHLTWHARKLKIGAMIPTNPVFEAPAFRFAPLEWAEFLAEQRDIPIPIKGVDLKLTSDIAICKVAQLAPDEPHHPLTIVQSGIIGVGMAVGKTATAVGYAGMTDTFLSPIRPSIIAGDFSFYLHVSQGAIEERFPDNLKTRSVATPGPCFSAKAKFPPGMSGSPIFDAEGIYVHGIVSKGWQDENGPIEFGYGSMIAPSMRLPIKSLQGMHLLKVLDSSDHGMPRLSAPDM